MRHIQLIILMAAAILLLAACGAPTQAERPALSSQATAEPATAPASVAPATMAPVSTAPPAEPAASTAVATETARADPTVTGTSPADATAVGTAPAPSATVAPAATDASPAAATAVTPGSATAETIVLALQPDSQASYRVREQLANVRLPNDAVGTTNAVSGTLSIQSDGSVLSDRSRFVVDLSTLRSDSGMRDNYIRRNTLQTDAYREAVFVPAAVEGLPSPLPTSGDVSFKMTGALTVRDITKPVTWDVRGKIAGNELTGTATTSFKFGDFGMTPPTTMRVLSIEDNIVLEIAFRLAAANS